MKTARRDLTEFGTGMTRLASSYLSLSLVGGTMVVGVLLLYNLAVPRFLAVSTATAGLLEASAYTVFCVIIAGLALAFVGLTRFLAFEGVGEKVDDSKSMRLIISSVLRERRSTRVLLVAGLAYGVLFASTSGTLVYRPGANFSYAYGVNIPGSVAVTCCGPVGQIPQLVVYLTQHLAILLVPVNLILLCSVSWLVGLNVAMIAYVYKYRSGSVSRGLLGSLGALTGLFSACPTCAGLFFMTFLGLSSTLSSSFVSSNLQATFVAAGIAPLVMAPILNCRRIRAVRNGACSLP